MPNLGLAFFAAAVVVVVVVVVVVAIAVVAVGVIVAATSSKTPSRPVAATTAFAAICNTWSGRRPHT